MPFTTYVVRVSIRDLYLILNYLIIREKKWEEFINKYELNDWINVYDPEHQSDYRSKYDVYSTPIIYLLDENKIIRGKKLDHSNILPIIEMLEKKKNNQHN